MTSSTSHGNLFLLIVLSASGFVAGSSRKSINGGRQQPQSPTSGGSPPRQVSFNISEGLPVGTLVGVLPTGNGNVGVGDKSNKFSVLAQYVDDGSGATSGGSANGGDAGSNNLLSVNPTSGAIVTSRVLDRERLCSGRSSTRCDVRLDVAVSPAFSVIRVTVSIDDVNDNPPTFRDRKLTRQVTESAPTGPVFQLPAAHDADGGSGNGISGYRLQPETSPFRLRVAGGPGSDVIIELLRPLDRETIDRYQLTLTAYDGGNPQLSGSVDIDVIVLDANDNGPQFVNVTTGHVVGDGRDGTVGVGYDVTLPASSPTGTDVITVTAIDPDLEENGAVRYRFAQKTEARYGRLFSINAETGLIQTTAERLEFGATSTLTLVVLAEDRGQNSVPSSVTVTVRATELNEHSPVISVDTLIPGRAEISENSPPNSFIAHVVATDADTGRGGEVDCYLDATSTTDPTPLFALIPLYGTEYKLVSTVSFDRESRDRYDVTLRCRDAGQPPLTSSVDVQIVVTDVDDNPPVFASPSYNFTLHENNARGQTIGRVSATDADFPGPNGVVVYSLDPEADVDAWFAVDPTSGVLTARVPFDREFVDRFEFDVIASSASVPASSTASSKSVSGQAKTGRESMAQVARTRVRVTVTDLDDEPPRFARSWYRFDVAENQSGGTEVGRVTAVDEDLSPFDGFLYHLETAAGDEKGTGVEGGGSAFAVDPVSGIIYTRRTLDREALSHYTLRIRAQSDSAPTGSAGASSASPPLSDVTIVFVRVTDVNDNAPEVTYPTLTDNTIRIRRRSDVKAGATVAVVTAHDRDAGVNAALSFSIADGNERGRFVIETTTGIIRWAVNEADLYDSAPAAGSSSGGGRKDPVGDCSWTLSIQVKDGGLVNRLSTTTRLHVVLDGCQPVSASGANTPETAYRLAAVSAGHSGGTGSRQLLPGLTDWYLFVVVVVIAGCIVVIGALITIVITVRQCSRRRKQNASRQTTMQKDCGVSTSAGSSAGGSDHGDVQLTLLRSNVDLQSYSPSGGSDDAVSSSGGGSAGLNTEQLLLHVIEGQKLESQDIAGLILALRQAQLRSRYQDSRLQIPRDRDTDSGCVDLSPAI